MGSMAVDSMELARKRDRAHTRPQGGQGATGPGMDELSVRFHRLDDQFTLRHDMLECLIWFQHERIVRWYGVLLMQRDFDACEAGA